MVPDLGLFMHYLEDHHTEVWKRYAHRLVNHITFNRLCRDLGLEIRVTANDPVDLTVSRALEELRRKDHERESSNSRTQQ